MEEGPESDPRVARIHTQGDRLKAQLISRHGSLARLSVNLLTAGVPKRLKNELEKARKLVRRICLKRGQADFVEMPPTKDHINYGRGAGQRGGSDRSLTDFPRGTEARGSRVSGGGVPTTRWRRGCAAPRPC